MVFLLSDVVFVSKVIMWCSGKNKEIFVTLGKSLNFCDPSVIYKMELVILISQDWKDQMRLYKMSNGVPGTVYPAKLPCAFSGDGDLWCLSKFFKFKKVDFQII